jgi:hypothetical protein
MIGAHITGISVSRKVYSNLHHYMWDFFLGAGRLKDWTQGLTHAQHALYHWSPRCFTIKYLIHWVSYRKWPPRIMQEGYRKGLWSHPPSTLGVLSFHEHLFPLPSSWHRDMSHLLRSSLYTLMLRWPSGDLSTVSKNTWASFLQDVYQMMDLSSVGFVVFFMLNLQSNFKISKHRKFN